MTPYDRLAAASADPESAVRYLTTFAARHPRHLIRIADHPTGPAALIAVFAHSRFLSDELLRHPEWMAETLGLADLYRVASRDDIAGRLGDTENLGLFRRREVLRILLRDVLGLATLSEITEELSSLADTILDAACRRLRASLEARHGVPLYEGQPCGFSVLALGKLGARELNYSSDIDLMFVYEGNGQTDSARPLTNKEFFHKLSNAITEQLSSHSVDGITYRVDLRLRPDGRHGEVCLSLDGTRAYYDMRARDWELQMLIKARVAAGQPEPGRDLLEYTESRTYSSTLDFSAVEAVSATRERIHEKLAARRADAGLDIKLARGGIRDIEFLVQCLQRLHGGREPWVRYAGTLLALQRLNDKKLISEAEYSRLATAYEFLRHLEHRLQIVDDRQTHSLPTSRKELEVLARRMPARELGRQPSADKLLHQLNVHLEEVQDTYDRVIHAQQPLYYSPPPPAAESSEPHLEPPEPPSSNLIRLLDQEAPGVARIVAATHLRRAARSFEAFLEQARQIPGALGRMNEDATLTADILDLFENSPYFSEELVRRPELFEEVWRARLPERSDYQAATDGLTDVGALRRFFRREMLRIQAESICAPVPVFETLGRTSDLADAVVAGAYVLARDQVTRSHPPSPSYEPRQQMMVIALGRLGMREFDLGSDADLNFVIPDEDAGEARFWTRVAERMVQLISAYTGEGVMFTVDTRLRPNGREGTLVQTVGAYKDYLANRAEAWEGITYMKSRAVVGDPKLSLRFLHELQDVDWRRYGQSGRSRAELRDMRARLEREQSEASPLKAAPGGFYDIDFALMYLRLKSAGIFYKVLNTPERISIIEQMGHLDRADAVFLNDAATLYRAIDHGLRVYSGHAEGRLPHSPAHLEALTTLVRRWTPDHLHDQPLPDELAQIRHATRALFRRLFG